MINHSIVYDSAKMLYTAPVEAFWLFADIKSSFLTIFFYAASASDTFKMVRSNHRTDLSFPCVCVCVLE